MGDHTASACAHSSPLLLSAQSEAPLLVLLALLHAPECSCIDSKADLILPV